jgi:hypothetical protein
MMIYTENLSMKIGSSVFEAVHCCVFVILELVNSALQSLTERAED